jgi:hypothetical protein
MSIHPTYGSSRGVSHRAPERRPARHMNPVLLSLLLLFTGGIAGCAVPGNSATVVESHSIGAGSARSVHVELAMQPGNLQVGGGAGRLVDARFMYQPSDWKPTISYRVSGGRGELVVRQPQLQSVTSGRNTWNIKLSDRIPIDLDVTSGPGNATLSLRTLTLNTLTVAAGPGNMSVDAGSPALKTLTASTGPGNLSVNLIAPWKHDVTATINGGIGNTTLRLPKGVGVRVALQGEGHVAAPDFTEREGAYVNSEFGHSKVTVQVSLSAGIGNVVLATEA